MTKNLPADQIAPPADLAAALRVHGLGAVLVVSRLDGAPLTDADRDALPVVLEGYALARELHPTDEEQAQAAAAVAALIPTPGAQG